MDEICWGQAVTLCKLPLDQSEVPENNFVLSLFYCHPKIIRDHFPVHLYIVTLSSQKNSQPTVYVNALKFHKKLNIYILICPNQHFTIGQTYFISLYHSMEVLYHAFLSVQCSSCFCVCSLQPFDLVS